MTERTIPANAEGLSSRFLEANTGATIAGTEDIITQELFASLSDDDKKLAIWFLRLLISERAA